jgi:hypothetical protein
MFKIKEGCLLEIIPLTFLGFKDPLITLVRGQL